MARRPVLWDFHRHNGAVFVERDGWLLPAHFAGASIEYDTVRSSTGLMDLAERGLLQITGPDRISFLQGMLSNDLRAIGAGQSQRSALLNQQGKIVADVRVLCSENSFYLDILDSLREAIQQHLNRYLVADEVEIADRSAEYSVISVQGPQSAALLEDIFGAGTLPERPLRHTMVSGGSICALSDSHTGETGFDLFIRNAELPNLARSLTERGISRGAKWVGEDAREILRLEAGIPRFGVDFTAENLLLEAGLRDAVSFTKGCYLGQEVVERIRSRGHVNRKLMGLLLDADVTPAPGAVVRAETGDVGRVTSAVRSPALGRGIALAYVNKDFWAPGTKVVVSAGEQSIGATVTEPPFVGAQTTPGRASAPAIGEN